MLKRIASGTNKKGDAFLAFPTTVDEYSGDSFTCLKIIK